MIAVVSLGPRSQFNDCP